MASAALRAMEQLLIREHQRHHRLHDGYGANANARIMAALGDDLRLVSFLIDGWDRSQDRRGWLKGSSDDDWLAAGDPAEDPARMVGEEHRSRANSVRILLAPQTR